jgi:signal transduction histidine kinase
MASIVNWVRGSVQHQAAVAFSVFTILFIVNAVYVFGFLSSSENDSDVVDLAGRQRMLSQRLSHEAFEVGAGDDSRRELLVATAAEFAQNLTDLRNGAAARGIAPPPPGVAGQLEIVQSIWDPMEANLNRLSEEAVENPLFDEALDYILNSNVQFLSAMDEVVELLTIPEGASLVAIDVAGRQRMLSQKLSKEAFAISAGDEASRETLLLTIAEIDTDLHDLVAGNSARGIPTASGAVATKLEAAQELWEPFMGAATATASESVRSPAFEEALAYVGDNNVALLSSTDTAVALYSEAFSSRITTLRQVVVGFSLFVTLVAATAWWFVGRFIGRPLNDARDALEMLARGDLSATLDVSSRDELGRMSEAYGALQQYMLEMGETAGEIAAGDLSAEVTPRSPEDTLGNAFVTTIREIKERERAGAELERLNTELAARSTERQVLVQQLLSAQEDERRSVAHEIHDGPAQQLAAAQMFLEAFAFSQEIDLDSPDSDYLHRAKSSLDSSLIETRRIMSGLRPAQLDDLGLADALSELLMELTELAEMELELTTGELADDLSPTTEITLYRVAQEATNNALKHSGGSRLEISLQSNGSVARLRVEDDGQGFNLEGVEGPRAGERHGLVGMRERVELLGGEFSIESSATGGTTIAATIPLNGRVVGAHEERAKLAVAANE